MQNNNQNRDPFDWRQTKKRVRERAKEKTQQFKRIPIRVLIPNLITLIALASGITAIRMAFEQRFELAVILLVVAIILDAVDGHIARMLKAASKFGAELDSLADIVNFGVAPAILIYAGALNDLRAFGWIAPLALVTCCALRLARYNAALEEDKPQWQNLYFSGVPAPAGAGLTLLPLYLGFLDVIEPQKWAIIIWIYLALVSALMVSKIPTFSTRGIGNVIQKDKAPIVLLALVLFIAIFINYIWQTLTIIAFLYLAAIPLSMKKFQKNLHKTQKNTHTKSQQSQQDEQDEQENSSILK